jgi:hypothetical protein
MTRDELMAAARAADTEYTQATEHALDQRDAKWRALKDQGLRQVDIMEATGRSRETVRQALDPAIREETRRRRRKTKE